MTFQIQTIPQPEPGSIPYERIGILNKHLRGLIHPFMKCPGGKRRLIRDFIKVLPNDFDRYVELCVGGGAMFFSLSSLDLIPTNDVGTPKAWLADLEKETIDAYKDIQTMDPELERMLRTYEQEYNEHSGHLTYYKILDRWNKGDRSTASMIFIRQAANHGAWCYDESGVLTMECSNYRELKFFYDNLKQAGKHLEGVTLVHNDITKPTNYEPSPNDLVYIDPPPANGYYTNYYPKPFLARDHISTIQYCSDLVTKGCKVIYTNMDNPQIRKWISEYWDNSTIYKVYANLGGNKRSDKADLIVIGGFTVENVKTS